MVVQLHWEKQQLVCQEWTMTMSSFGGDGNDVKSSAKTKYLLLQLYSTLYRPPRRRPNLKRDGCVLNDALRLCFVRPEWDV